MEKVWQKKRNICLGSVSFETLEFMTFFYAISTK